MHGEVTSYRVLVNGVTVLDVSTPRDAMGRIDTRTETLGMQTTSIDYVYDPAGRLEEVKNLATSQVLAHYDYDPNGNRLGRTSASGTETGAYDAQDRLEAYGGRTYAYTLTGSLASMTEGNATTTYHYDALGGLRQVVKPNGDDIQYVVDGAGRRVWKMRNGTRVQGFVYASALRPVAELDGAGNIVARFIYGRHVNVPDLMIKNGRTYRIVTDHLGSPRFVIDTATGAIAQTKTYDEYGRVTSDSAPGFQPFGFAGGMYDVDTGLVRFGARDYDAFTGRWTAKDPIRFAGGDTNLYAYVGNEPVNRRDPRGLWILQAAGVVLGAGAQAITNYNAYATGRIDGVDYVGSILWGAGVGFVASFAPGIISGALAGGFAAGLNESANQVLFGAKAKNGADVIHAMGVGAACGFVAGGLGAVGGKIPRPDSIIGKPLPLPPPGTYADTGGIIGNTAGTIWSTFFSD